MKKRRVPGTSEAVRIADQLRRAFYGSAWHGPSVLELIKDIDAKTAAAKSLDDVHSIWELVLHIQAWDRAGLIRLGGKKCQMKGTKNFPPVTTASDVAWREAVAQVKSTHDQLVETVAGLSELRLRDQVPGKGTIFITCCMGLRNMSCITPGRLRF